jgi:chromosomal replication initiator protein DnaA
MVVRSTPAPPLRHHNDSEFESFLSDVASVLAEQVKGWRVQLGEGIAKWASAGYVTTALEREMQRTDSPDVAAIVKSFELQVEELRDLEERAAAVDMSARGSAIFRDVEAIPQAQEHLQKLLAATSSLAGPAPEFTRATFEVGPSNELAVRVSDMVVAQPGSKYNPLFIHAPAGVGRTHLLHAVGNELVNASGGAARVILVGAQTFIDELVKALQDGTIERFRAQYRAADALIIDDVHYICGKERTQDEIFHIFNAFHGAGRQIVLSADRHPKDLEGLEERLRSRFEGGVVVGMAPPDRIVREKLYAGHLRELDTREPEKLWSYLAERPTESVRETIETAYRLRAAAAAAGLPLSIEFARTELGRSTPARVQRATPAEHLDAFFLDEEKVVWRWPNAGARLIEDLR